MQRSTCHCNAIIIADAGLPDGVRSVVEFAFKSGALSVLVCTSTLAAGVNLPARRVLVYGLHVGRELLSLTQVRPTLALSR